MEAQSSGYFKFFPCIMCDPLVYLFPGIQKGQVREIFYLPV